MPKSKMQAEFVKATKVDESDYEDRQDFLTAVIEKVNTFKDPQWNKLSEEAQDWINTAIKKMKAKKRVPEFPDVGSVPKDDDKPAKKAKGKAADEDEEDEEEEEEKPAKKKKAKAADEEDEDEDEEEADDEDEESEDDDESEDDEDDEDEEEEEEEEKPAKKKKAAKAAKKKAKPAADDDEDEEDEDEEEEDEKPAKKKKAKPADDEDEDDDKPAKKKKAKQVEAKPSGVKVAIKTAIVEDPEISVDALIKKLGKGGAPVSKVTVSNVRAEFRHTLRVLKELGKLKGIDL